MLLPTLLIAAYHNPELLLAMQESVSDELMAHYLEAYISANSTSRSLSSVPSCLATSTPRYCLPASHITLCLHTLIHKLSSVGMALLRSPGNAAHMGLVVVCRRRASQAAQVRALGVLEALQEGSSRQCQLMGCRGTGTPCRPLACPRASTSQHA